MRLQNLTNQHLPAHGRHGALDIRRRSPRRKVLRQHGKRPRESPYRDLRRRAAALLLLLLLLLLPFLTRGSFGSVEDYVGLRGVDALQGGRELRCSSGGGVRDARGEGVGRVDGRVEVVGPFTVDVSGGYSRGSGGDALVGRSLV